MKKFGIAILMLCVYAIPFVYFSMYKDFINGSMMGYIVMLASYFALAYMGKSTKRIPIIVIGNLLSLVVLFLFVINMTDEMWLCYFKPLWPIQLLILVSGLNVIPQLVAIRLANKHNIKKTIIVEVN